MYVQLLIPCKKKVVAWDQMIRVSIGQRSWPSGSFDFTLLSRVETISWEAATMRSHMNSPSQSCHMHHKKPEDIMNISCKFTIILHNIHLFQMNHNHSNQLTV